MNVNIQIQSLKIAPNLGELAGKNGILFTAQTSEKNTYKFTYQ